MNMLSIFFVCSGHFIFTEIKAERSLMVIEIKALRWPGHERALDGMLVLTGQRTLGFRRHLP